MASSSSAPGSVPGFFTGPTVAVTAAFQSCAPGGEAPAKACKDCRTDGQTEIEDWKHSWFVKTDPKCKADFCVSTACGAHKGHLAGPVKMCYVCESAVEAHPFFGPRYKNFPDAAARMPASGGSRPLDPNAFIADTVRAASTHSRAVAHAARLPEAERPNFVRMETQHTLLQDLTKQMTRMLNEMPPDSEAYTRQLAAIAVAETCESHTRETVYELRLLEFTASFHPSIVEWYRSRYQSWRLLHTQHSGFGQIQYEHFTEDEFLAQVEVLHKDFKRHNAMLNATNAQSKKQKVQCGTCGRNHSGVCNPAIANASGGAADTGRGGRGRRRGGRRGGRGGRGGQSHGGHQ